MTGERFDRRRMMAVALVVSIAALIVSSIWVAQNIIINFTFLDLVLIGIAVAAGGFNLWQWITGKYKERSLTSILAALFNDVKAKQGRCLQRQQFLVSNPPADVETARLEFYDSLNEMVMSLDQLKEHVVGALFALDPKASSDLIFRSTDFGLTESEKERRRRYVEAFQTDPRLAFEAQPAAPGQTLSRAEQSFGVRDFPVRQEPRT